MTRSSSQRGSTLLEVLFVSGVVATLGGIAVPQTLVALDDFRAAGRNIEEPRAIARPHARGHDAVLLELMTAPESSLIRASVHSGFH